MSALSVCQCTYLYYVLTDKRHIGVKNTFSHNVEYTN